MQHRTLQAVPHHAWEALPAAGWRHRHTFACCRCSLQAHSAGLSSAGLGRMGPSTPLDVSTQNDATFRTHLRTCVVQGVHLAAHGAAGLHLPFKSSLRVSSPAMRPKAPTSPAASNVGSISTSTALLALQAGVSIRSASCRDARRRGGRIASQAWRADMNIQMLLHAKCYQKKTLYLEHNARHGSTCPSWAGIHAA